MTYLRLFLVFSCRVAVVFVLLQSFWIFAAQYISPKLPQVAAGSLLRSPFEELEDVPPQQTEGDLAELQGMVQLRKETPADALFLTFHQRSFAYYAERRFISDLDPRLVDFYRARDKRTAIAVLRRLCVDYVYLPSWSWPTIANSFIKDIVGDSQFSTKIFSRNGYELYRLNPSTPNSRSDYLSKSSPCHS